MRQLIFFLLLSLGLLACTQDVPPPPPVLGPAVLTDAGVEVVEWEYLGVINSWPPVSNTMREVGDERRTIRLVEQADGFDLIWSQFPCATQPVLVIHLDHTLEFWSGGGIKPDCESMRVSHMLTVKLDEAVPLDQWTLTHYPPPPPES